MLFATSTINLFQIKQNIRFICTYKCQLSYINVPSYTRFDVYAFPKVKLTFQITILFFLQVCTNVKKVAFYTFI